MSIEEDRLNAIVEYIDRLLSVSSPLYLLEIKAFATGEELTLEDTFLKKQKIDKIIISCDASIKVNPGGPSSVGVVISIPGSKNLELAQGTPATSNNQAEYDAIYYGITSLIDLHNVPQFPIEIRSDSQLAIKQLNGDMKCNDESLQKRRDIILELVKSLPTEIKFVWRPRNSTPELKLANYLCQDYLGVARH